MAQESSEPSNAGEGNDSSQPNSLQIGFLIQNTIRRGLSWS